MRVTRAALALAAAVAACAPVAVQPNSASVAPALQSGSSATPALTTVPTVSSPSPSSSGTRADAVQHATDVATEWVAALRARDYQSAWPLLSSATQASYGSFERFVADRNAFMDSAKGLIRGLSIDADPRSLDSWIAAAPGANPNSAFLATVDYPALAARNNEQEILVVGPDGTGTWRIWVVR